MIVKNYRNYLLYLPEKRIRAPPESNVLFDLGQLDTKSMYAKLIFRLLEMLTFTNSTCRLRESFLSLVDNGEVSPSFVLPNV